MLRLALLALLIGSCGTAWAQTASPAPPVNAGVLLHGMPVYTVTQLPASAALGAMVYVSDCRAVAQGLAAVGTQAAGAGTGCLATYNTNGSVWQVAGTNITVAK